MKADKNDIYMFISTTSGLMVANLTTITNSNTGTTIKYIYSSSSVSSSSFYNNFLFACTSNKMLIFKL